MPLRRLLARFRPTPGHPTRPCQSQWIAFDLEPALGYPLRLHLAPWRSDHPFGWFSEINQAPLAQGHFLEPPGIGWELLQATHGETLMQGMPAAVRRVIACAPFLGVELAQACGRLPPAEELAGTSPLLLILLVDWASEAGLTQAQVADCLAQKQSLLCATLGLPEGRAIAKLLRRCALRPMLRRELLALKRTLNRPRDTALLRHHHSLHLDHLGFLAHYEGPRWPGLLAVVDGILERSGETAWLHRLLADVGRLLGEDTQALRQVASLPALQRLHDRQVDRLNDQIHQAGCARSAAALQASYGDYPTPPLSGHEWLVPVTSWEELLREGHRMRHCVGSYHRAVAEGRVALYHLSDPEPVTVAIQPQGNGWALSEARGRHNAMPSAEASQRIQAWLLGAPQARGHSDEH